MRGNLLVRLLGALMTKRRALRFVFCSLVFCNIEAGAGGALQGQRVAPVAARATFSIAVGRPTFDSLGVERAHHAVIGAAIGAVAGVAIGYHRGRVEDARCGGECGGPRIATLVDPPLFGLLGAAIGAAVGYLFPAHIL